MEEKKVLNKKKIFIIAGSIVAVLLAIYVGVSVFYRGHFYPGTKLNGMDVSNQTAAKVQQMAEDSISSYALTLVERGDAKETISGTDIGLELQPNEEIDQLVKKQSGFGWVAAIFGKRDLTTKPLVAYDEAKLKEVISKLDCMDASKQKEPVDATVSEFEAGKGYSVVPCEEGTTLDEAVFLEKTEEGIVALADTIDLDAEKCYREPAVKDDDEKLNKMIESLNSYAKSVINYQIGDKTQTLDGSTFGSWLCLDGDLNPQIIDDCVNQYVDELAATYDTVNGSKTFKTTYGPTVTIGNVHYGWKVDKEAEAAQIKEDIKSGQTVTRDLNYSQTAESHGANDYGNSYVEINITAQHLYLYDKGSMVLETDFVSGNLSDGVHYTPNGVFGITYCQKNATLRGPGYATPVSYWMPFNGDIGLHDAGWRSDFGAAIYFRNGSHGCVNLPPSAAKVIFDHVYTNYPVIVYTLPGTETQRNLAQQAAYGVIDAIKAIGEVTTLDSKPAVEDARAKYDALSDMGKGFVKNYDTLVQDEQVIATLLQQKADADKAAADKAAADKAAADKAAADKAAAEKEAADKAAAEAAGAATTE